MPGLEEGTWGESVRHKKGAEAPWRQEPRNMKAWVCWRYTHVKMVRLRLWDPERDFMATVEACGEEN